MEIEYSTSITQINQCLIVSLASEMTDASMNDVMNRVTTEAYHSGIRGAILNFSMVNVMDLDVDLNNDKIMTALNLEHALKLLTHDSPGNKKKE